MISFRAHPKLQKLLEAIALMSTPISGKPNRSAMIREIVARGIDSWVKDAQAGNVKTYLSLAEAREELRIGAILEREREDVFRTGGLQGRRSRFHS